jgi:SSS family solute:Na+ symporter
MVVLISFFAVTVFVAIWSLVKYKSSYSSSLSGFFLAGKSNNYWIVGSALILTNLSANQFIGENESVYINNMSVIAWGVTSVFAMLLVSEFLLPIYFKYGFRTIPDFLSLRYDSETKLLVTIIILIGYIVNLLPPVLYGGALSLVTMFNITEIFQISYWQSIWVLVWALGIIGSMYSIFGGLKLISLSDLGLGLGLFVLTLLIPLFGLWYLGEGNIWHGISIMLNTKKQYLNAVGSSKDAIPFSTLFTGMLLINFYYWGMEPYIAQQTLSAKNLSEAQKGMTLAAAAKLVIPLIINLPGLLAVHLIPGVEETTAIFPKLIMKIFPDILVGFSLALVFGAAMTTYTAGLQSCGSLFVYNIFKPYIERNPSRHMTEKKYVQVGKYFELFISLLAMLIAPFILFAPDGFYTYLQSVSGFFNMPIFTIMVLGILSPRITPRMAQIGLVLYMLFYFLLVFMFNVDIHYLHLFALLFIGVSLITWIGSLLWGEGYYSTYKFNFKGLDYKYYWKSRYVVGCILFATTILIYILLSPLGIAA